MDERDRSVGTIRRYAELIVLSAVDWTEAGLERHQVRRWAVIFGLFLASVAMGGCSDSETRVGDVPAPTVTLGESTVTTEPEPEPVPEQERGGLKLLAHRGLYQSFDREGVDDQTCTAEHVYPIEHGYIENTVPSIRAAFALGAEVVEIDIAASSDGVLVVFHDWTVDCRTDGTGEVRSLSWDQMSQLDVGHGYTSDDGQTFPLRGQGKGLMPRLEEVLAEFPDGRFLINLKSSEPVEVELLHEVIENDSAADQIWAVYGDPVAVESSVSLSMVRGFTEAGILDCLTRYMTTADEADRLCSDTVVAVPIDVAPLLPGWPEQFIENMAELGTYVIIVGPGTDGVTGIDTADALATIPPNLDAYVWTDRIDLVGSNTETDE